jgi:microcystin degradation protein MlrC
MTEFFFRGGNATTPGAAVACMGYATASTHTRYNNVMAVGFYHAFLEGDVPEVGSCLVHSKYELFMTLPPGMARSRTSATGAT